MHNWRCAGSTMNSLLSSNFGGRYTKVGTQFTETGWPNYNVPELLTIDQVRKNFRVGGILGGHLCSGIESVVGGSWDIWMNARMPVKRLSSGVMRFHAAQFRAVPGVYTRHQAIEMAQQKLADLIAGPLQHEANGVAKRLAGFAVAESMDLRDQSDLEKASCFSTSVSNDELLSAALRQMERVKVIVLPEYLHASLMSIEKLYTLGPIINLFSDLRHNPVSLGKPSKDEKDLFELSKPMLKKMCSVDRELWKPLMSSFQRQLHSASVGKRDVRVREILHEKALLSVKLHDRQIADEELIEIISVSLVTLAKQHKELSEDIISTACQWRRFAPDASAEIKSRALHKLRLS
jgi:hypothetical protein